MKQKLRTQLSIIFVLFALLIVALISLAANVLINQQFEKYIEAQQKSFSDSLAENLKFQYDPTTKTWNVDYIHGVGMYALNDGYIVKLVDARGKTVWDAENHDMKQCHQLMQNISERMAKMRPGVQGNFTQHTYTLKDAGTAIGKVTISYYSPYYLNENAFQFLDSLNLIVLIVGIISIIGAAVAAVVLARRLSAPIVKTIDVTREISQGDYAARITTETKTAELDELAQSVNQMAHALEEQESLRKRLTSDVAHELRTPLSNASLHLEALIEGVWEPTPERLQSTYDEIARLGVLVNSLQKLSQAESDHLSLERENLDLYELAERALRDFELDASARHISIDLLGEPAIVIGDKNRLYQVIANLIANALNYSEAESTITLAVEQSEANCSLSVADTGMGIAPEDAKHIFERFYRTDLSRNRATGGVGIGLAIAQSIAQAHGGTLTVESELGKGSTFTLTLPRA